MCNAGFTLTPQARVVPTTKYDDTFEATALDWTNLPFTVRLIPQPKKTNGRLCRYSSIKTLVDERKSLVQHMRNSSRGSVKANTPIGKACRSIPCFSLSFKRLNFYFETGLMDPVNKGLS